MHEVVGRAAGSKSGKRKAVATVAVLCASATGTLSAVRAEETIVQGWSLPKNNSESQSLGPVNSVKRVKNHIGVWGLKR